MDLEGHNACSCVSHSVWVRFLTIHGERASNPILYNVLMRLPASEHYRKFKGESSGRESKDKTGGVCGGNITFECFTEGRRWQ